MLNVQKVLQLLRKNLERDWAKLDFEYVSGKDEVRARASLTLNNHDDDIEAIIAAYPGGGAVFRAVFDKIEKTEAVLGLLNDFNNDDPFFKAFVREDEYLELRHFFVCYEEAMFKSYAGEFLARLAGLADNKILQELTLYTHE